MAMVSSLFTAISGMRNHQVLLDVIANNVANVNTIGFKSGRVMFSDLLSQTVSSAVGSDPLTNRGGINPVQLGLGATVASIDTQHTQGSLQITGNATDMAINGDGYFKLMSGSQELYTRAGSFSFDSAGRLVDTSGALVQGWMAEAQTRPDGTVDPLKPLAIDSSNTTNVGNITINSGMLQQPKETTAVALVGNLDAGATYTNLTNSVGVPGTTQLTVVGNDLGGIADAGTVFTYTVGYHESKFTVFDSLGGAHELTVKFTNLSGTQIPGAIDGTGGIGPQETYANNTWAWTVDTDPNDSTVHLALDNTTYLDPDDTSNNTLIRAASSGLIHFSNNGSLDWVGYSDRNADHFGTNLNPTVPAGQGNDPTVPGYTIPPALPGTWQVVADADGRDGSMIGFEGNIVDTLTGASLSGIPTDVFLGDTTDLAANPIDGLVGSNTGWDNVGAFELTKLPIVLVFQNVPSALPPPPGAVTTGERVQTLDGAGLVVNGINLAGSGVIEDWYVQSFEIDWGTVSTIKQADFDRAGDVFPLTTGEGAGGTMDGASAGDDNFPVGPPIIVDGHEYAWDPQIGSENDGLRDGMTQDVTGQWTISGGVSTYQPNFTARLQSQDGYATGVLQSVQVDPSGTIFGKFSNEQVQAIAQVAVASFENPAGLAKVGGVHFIPTANSGIENLGTALTGPRGSIVGGALEQSNVDLAKELTDMIIAQRGFEVNARLVTTSDRILDTLVNLGR